MHQIVHACMRVQARESLRTFCAACADSFIVGGAEKYQPAMMGAYTKVVGLISGPRPVYKRVGSTVAYLYYWPSSGEWSISANYTSDKSRSLKSAGAGALCPELATGWKVLFGGAWVFGEAAPIIKVVPGAR